MGRLRAILSRTRRRAAKGEATPRHRIADVLHEDAVATLDATTNNCGPKARGRSRSPRPLTPSPTGKHWRNAPASSPRGAGSNKPRPARSPPVHREGARVVDVHRQRGTDSRRPRRRPGPPARPLLHRSCSEVRRSYGADDGRRDAALDRLAAAIRRRLKPEGSPDGTKRCRWKLGWPGRGHHQAAPPRLVVRAIIDRAGGHADRRTCRRERGRCQAKGCRSPVLGVDSGVDS